MVSQKPIFRRVPVASASLVFFVLIGLALIFVSTFTSLLIPARAFFVDLVAPFYHVTDVPSEVREWTEDNLLSRDELLSENERLENENLILRRRTMTLASTQAENARMRQLLSASELVEEHVLIAELVGTPPGTEAHRLIIDRGSLDDVHIGQPVIDASGVFGQVVVAGDETSELILISDPEHALPVEVLRNGARAIAHGTGDYGELRLRNVSPTLDIRVGDELVSSGFGRKFPRGYPVGTVSSVERQSSSPFMDIRILPTAGLQTSRQLLLVFSEKREIGVPAPDLLQGSADSSEAPAP